MIVLLSPSKTLDFDSSHAKIKCTSPALLKESELLVADLKKMSAGEVGKLMKISEKLAQLNFERFQNFKTPFSEGNSKPCIFAFKGDVYDGLEAETLDKDDLKFAQEHLRILSGLYGLLKPYDLMQPYRLEMGTKFANKRGKDLYQFWGSRISEQIGRDIVNLASNEYFKAVDKKAYGGKITNIHFKEKKGDEYKVIGLFAKKARGMMARYIIKNRLQTVDKTKNFTEGGYKFMPKLSSETDLVFAR